MNSRGAPAKWFYSPHYHTGPMAVRRFDLYGRTECKVYPDPIRLPYSRMRQISQLGQLPLEIAKRWVDHKNAAKWLNGVPEWEWHIIMVGDKPVIESRSIEVVYGD